MHIQDKSILHLAPNTHTNTRLVEMYSVNLGVSWMAFAENCGPYTILAVFLGHLFFILLFLAIVLKSLFQKLLAQAKATIVLSIWFYMNKAFPNSESHSIITSCCVVVSGFGMFWPWCAIIPIPFHTTWHSTRNTLYHSPMTWAAQTAAASKYHDNCQGLLAWSHPAFRGSVASRVTPAVSAKISWASPHRAAKGSPASPKSYRNHHVELENVLILYVCLSMSISISRKLSISKHYPNHYPNISVFPMLGNRGQDFTSRWKMPFRCMWSKAWWCRFFNWRKNNDGEREKHQSYTGIIHIYIYNTSNT